MAKKKPQAREGVKVPLFVIVIVLVVSVGAWWWLEHRDRTEPKPTWSDLDSGTTPIQERLETFRRSWNAGALDEIHGMCMIAQDRERRPILERRVKEYGWETGLPTVGEPSVDRTGPHRYTVSWPVDGLPEPIVTFWEWDQGSWQIATWKIPPAE